MTTCLFPVEDELSADFVRDRVNDMTDESIEVVSVELSDHTESVFLRRVDRQLMIGERIDGIGRKRYLVLIVIRLALDLNVDVKISDGGEVGGDRDGLDVDGHVLWSPFRAMVEDEVADESVASLRRNRAVFLVFSVSAIVVSIAEEEVADALWIVSSTLVLMVIT